MKRVLIPKRYHNMIFFLSLIFLTLFTFYLANYSEKWNISAYDNFEGFSVVFLSILLEAVPFVLIGTFVSSIIQLYVSEKTIAKIIPKNRFLGLLIASLLGLIFPLCECTIVPVMRGLLKKGVPVHIAVTFMLAVPIVNPVVLGSTYYAFSGNIEMVLLRGFLGLVGAIIIGHIVETLNRKENPLLNSVTHQSSCSCGIDEDHEHAHENHNVKTIAKNSAFVFPNAIKSEEPIVNKLPFHKDIFKKIKHVISHTSGEFYDVGKFLIIGAFLSSFLQTLVSRNDILSIGQGQVISIIIMMMLAFLLSLCSEADAFIARTFVGQFTNGSIVAFLIFGPMIDLKNTLMLLGSFKTRFVIILALTIAVVTFLLSLSVNILGV
jgi:uncharacterized membrane protein YraQ (UPF0718 family)